MWEYLFAAVKYTSGYGMIDVLDPTIMANVQNAVNNNKGQDKIIGEERVEDPEIPGLYTIKFKKINESKAPIDPLQYIDIRQRDLRTLDFVASASVTAFVLYGAYKIVKYVEKSIDI